MKRKIFYMFVTVLFVSALLYAGYIDNIFLSNGLIH